MTSNRNTPRYHHHDRCPLPTAHRQMTSNNTLDQMAPTIPDQQRLLQPQSPSFYALEPPTNPMPHSQQHSLSPHRPASPQMMPSIMMMIQRIQLLPSPPPLPPPHR